jgi:phage nucleotide-binding protein
MSEEEVSPISKRILAVKALPKTLAMLVYGRSGTGKTTFASSFPKPALLIDVREKGTDSIANVDGVDVIQLESWQDLEDIYWYISNEKKYKTVIIDQISSLQDMAMEKAMEDESKDAMSMRLWGTVSGLMKTWLMNYRDLIDQGINVCFIAHDRLSKEGDGDEDQIEPLMGPRLMPSVAGLICGAVKVIGSTYIRENFLEDQVRQVEYRMRLGPHAYYVTKLRNPLGSETPESILNPTFEKIVHLMSGAPKPAPKRLVKPEAAPAETSTETPPLVDAKKLEVKEKAAPVTTENPPKTKEQLNGKAT